MIPNTIANINSVATWLTTLSLPGIEVRDLYNIPETIQPQDCPILCPDASEAFMTGITLKRLTFRDSVNGRRFEVHYDLHYMLFGAAVVEDISYLQKMGDLADLHSQCITAFAANDTPTDAWDIRPTGTPHFGIVADSSDVRFYGVRFTLSVQEFD